MAARDGNLGEPSGVGILVDDRPGGEVAVDDRHLQHFSGGRGDGQERTVSGPTLRPQCRQDHVADRIVMIEYLEERLVEAAARVAFGGRQKLVVEVERIEEGPEPGIVVVAEAFVIAERIGHLGERLAEVLGDHLLIGDVVGDLTQAVHVIGKRDEPRRHLVLGENAEGVPHHGGARNLAEGADMRKPGRTVTRLEDDGAGRLWDSLQPAQDLARFLEGPRLADMGMRQELRVHLDLGGAGRGFRIGHCRSLGNLRGPTNFTDLLRASKSNEFRSNWHRIGTGPYDLSLAPGCFPLINSTPAFSSALRFGRECLSGIASRRQRAGAFTPTRQLSLLPRTP